MKKDVPKKILLTIGILLLLNILILSFVSNFNAAFLVQGIIALALIVYGLMFHRIKKAVHIVMLCLCVVPFVPMVALGLYGSVDSTGYNEDAVIVLGAGIRGERVSLPLARRLDSAYEYYTRNPQAVIVVCGGQGYQEDITEALAMERYLMARGVPQESILKEEQSTSTWENLSNAQGLLVRRFPQGFTCVLITNDFHVFRAESLARRAGLTAGHRGVITDWYTVPNNYIRELMAIGKMILTQ